MSSLKSISVIFLATIAVIVLVIVNKYFNFQKLFPDSSCDLLEYAWSPKWCLGNYTSKSVTSKICTVVCQSFSILYEPEYCKRTIETAASVDFMEYYIGLSIDAYTAGTALGLLLPIYGVILVATVSVISSLWEFCRILGFDCIYFANLTPNMLAVVDLWKRLRSTFKRSVSYLRRVCVRAVLLGCGYPEIDFFEKRVLMGNDICDSSEMTVSIRGHRADKSWRYRSDNRIKRENLREARTSLRLKNADVRMAEARARESRRLRKENPDARTIEDITRGLKPARDDDGSDFSLKTGKSSCSQLEFTYCSVPESMVRSRYVKRQNREMAVTSAKKKISFSTPCLNLKGNEEKVRQWLLDQDKYQEEVVTPVEDSEPITFIYP